MILGHAEQPLLKVRDLQTHFPVQRGFLGRTVGLLRAVDGVTLDVPRGTTLGIVGESGCGKTTLARTILRLIDATSGSVRFDGLDVLSASRTVLRRLRRNMQIVFQDGAGSLDPRMNLGQIVAEPLVVHGLARGRRLRGQVAELLVQVGLRSSDAERYPHELSGGQRQRVGIARAIATNPRLLVCDEPVSALDVSIQAQILNLLANLQRRHALTCVFITHNLAVVRHVSDRVAVMYLGKIVEIADSEDLCLRPAHPYTIALFAAALSSETASCRHRVRPAGETPELVNPPSGCAFHPRCPLAAEECRSVSPELIPRPALSPSHCVACHYSEKARSLMPER